jgi:hypothetical protein
MLRYCLLFVCLMATIQPIYAQTGDQLKWTWMKGGKYATSVPHYGIRGVEAPDNQPPARFGAATWIDTSGHLWLFGGSRLNGLNYNDLWTFNPDNNRWTWIAGDSIPNQYGEYGTLGQPAITNNPRARDQMMAWISRDNQLWLYGGSYNYSGVEFGVLGDWWKFDPVSRQWTWMGGNRVPNAEANFGIKGTARPSNYPGAGYLAISWTDQAGRFWMFGGGFYTEHSATVEWSNKLWVYDPQTGMWTWVHGEVRGHDVIYGIQQVPDRANNPGQRLASPTWVDNDGNLWLFGGEMDMGRKGNDLWKYNIATNEWVWVKGDTLPPGVGAYWPATYGTRNVPAASNNPGSRQGAAAWNYGNNRFLMFGGLGTVTEINLGHLNDLWLYDIPTNTWTWLKGDSAVIAPGDYGLLQQPDVNNNPPGRAQPAAWQSKDGTNWLFGGLFLLADVWKLDGSRRTDSTVVFLQGEAVQLDAQLNWQTNVEWGTQYFELQHSTDQVHFDSITRVAATGNYQLPHQYSYLDTNAIIGINYYRLKVMERLGHYFYSDTVAVAIAKANQGAMLFPNPTQDILYYQSNDSTAAKWQIQVVDATGRKLLEKAWINYSGALQSLNVSWLPAGVYFLRVLKPGRIQIHRFVKY